MFALAECDWAHNLPTIVSEAPPETHDEGNNRVIYSATKA